MRPILGKEGEEVLAQALWSRVLLAFDFDGTLAPIVREHDGARMRARTLELFARVCELYPCAVISGRSREDVTTRLGGAQVAHVIGNHGLEPHMSIAEFEREVAETLLELEAVLERTPGVEVEDKRYSFAVHYRKSRNRRDAKNRIAEAVASLGRPMRTIAGKAVLNVLPAAAPHKGDALLRLRALEGADTALYVGDDVTDEDVFELDQPGRLLTIRVGRSPRSAAAYYLQDQREMDHFLETIVELHGLAAEQ